MYVLTLGITLLASQHPVSKVDRLSNVLVCGGCGIQLGVSNKT
jgi:hypothetical protein